MFPREATIRGGHDWNKGRTVQNSGRCKMQQDFLSRSFLFFFLQYVQYANAFLHISYHHSALPMPLVSLSSSCLCHAGNKLTTPAAFRYPIKEQAFL